MSIRVPARDVGVAILLSAGLSIYSLAWRAMLDRSGRFSADASTWQRNVGMNWTNGSLVAICTVLAVGIVAAQRSRGVHTLKGGLAIGLLIALVSVPAVVSAGFTTGLGPYIALRTTMLVLGFVATSVAAVALRR